MFGSGLVVPASVTVPRTTADGATVTDADALLLLLSVSFFAPASAVLSNTEPVLPSIWVSNCSTAVAPGASDGASHSTSDGPTEQLKPSGPCTLYGDSPPGSESEMPGDTAVLV